MSLNSIDFQVVFQKSGEVSRIQTLQQDQGNIQNQQIVSGVKQEFNRQEKAVKNLDYIEKKNIGREGSKKGRQKNASNKEREQAKKEDSGSEEKILKHLGNHLDLHI